MNNKTIQELKENFYILYEKYLQEKKEQTGEEVFPTKATLLNLLLNETERYIGGNFDGTRLFTNHEVDILNQAHALLFKLYKDELIRLYTLCVRHFFQHASNRNSYCEGVSLLRNLIKYGGKTEADDIVMEQRNRTPRRPALIDELSKLYKA